MTGLRSPVLRRLPLFYSMDFRLSEEEKLIKNTAAQFVDRELIAREGTYLKQEQLFLPPGDPKRRELQPQVKATLADVAKRIGLWTLELPSSPDGTALSTMSRVLIHREFGRTILPFAPPCIPTLMANTGHLQALADGEMSLTLAFDQVHRTGTLSSVETRFRPTTAGYLLGNATIDVFAPPADLYLFPAKEQGTDRVCAFLLSRDTPGFSIGEEVDLTTDSTVARISLRECKTLMDALVGYEYETAAIVAAEQLRIASRCLGIAMRCLESSIEHARNRVTFGRPLSARQSIQWMLADLSIELRTCTWLTLETAWRADQEQPYFAAAALAKKRAAKMAFTAADTAIQIHGGYGVCKEFPFEGFYREARMLRLLYGREAELDRSIGERYLSTEQGAWGREQQV
jgi:alkylation response protein AidB-like acyl-CoA dehydrogenase